MDIESPTYRSPRANLRLFLVGTLLLGITGGIYEAVFNNYLSDILHLTADQRGFLEFPRELPGFAVVFLTGLLAFLPETRMAAFCCGIIGIGLVGIGYFGDTWYRLIFWSVVWSVGVHMMMVLRSSLSLGLANTQQKGRRLGQVNGVSTAATIAGAGIVWLLFHYYKTDYALMYYLGAGAALLAGVFFFLMRMPGGNLKRTRFVWNRKYWLFYLLALFFGGRKQIFITFAPWVLVVIYKQPAQIIAQLLIVASIIGIFFQPFLGRLIDRLGERTILTCDAVLVAAVCLGYGYAHLAGSEDAALHILYACFVWDVLLFGCNMARTTYLTKIAARKEDLSPTISLGITLDHAISMVVPTLGGLIWERYGYTTVFLVATGLACAMFLFARLVPSRRLLTRIQQLNRN